MASPPAPHRGNANAGGIARTERAGLLLLGGLVSFAGFVLLLVGGLAVVVRLLVGGTVVSFGVGLCALASRPAVVLDRAQLSPAALAAIERLALVPLAVLAGAGCVTVVVAPGVAGSVRLVIGVAAALLATLLGWIVLRNRLPDNLPQGPPAEPPHTTEPSGGR